MNRFVVLTVAFLTSTAYSEEPVTAQNFARAETDNYIRVGMQAAGIGVNQLHHYRDPVTAENQTVIRQNQDTLFSGIILDLSTPVSFTLPDTGGRYMSMHVVNQDHFMFVETSSGTYTLTEETVGTRFAYLIVRTFVDTRNPDDVKQAHAAQDGIIVSGGGMGPFEAPDWNLDDLKIIRDSLSDVAALGFDSSYAFGTENETRPVDHLIGVAAGWGGLPRAAALYSMNSVDRNDGSTPHSLTARNVPVDEFWSITVYNANGYLEANDLAVNGYNNFTADPNADGSHTIHFGGCDDGRTNCIPITPGWNYTVRMYGPRPEILDGSWTFPEPKPTR